jgi:hypothetical protein
VPQSRKAMLAGARYGERCVMQANERRKADAEAAESMARAEEAPGLQAAHSNGVYRVALSPTPEVTASLGHGPGQNGASPSGAGQIGVSPGGGKRGAPRPNVSMQCCQGVARRRVFGTLRRGW